MLSILLILVYTLYLLFFTIAAMTFFWTGYLLFMRRFSSKIPPKDIKASANVTGAFTVTLPPNRTISKLGLLDEAKDISKVKHFSKDMTVESSQQILHDRNVVFNHILQDINKDWRSVEPYLSSAHTAIRDFLYSGEVADRKNLTFTLETLADTRGQYMIILGSKGLGKSTMLKEIEKRHCERIFRIDMRQNKDLISGLMGALKMQYSYQQKSFQSVITSIVQGVAMIFREYTNLKDKKLTEKVTEEKNTLSFLLHQMIGRFGPITVIIDEANLPFSRPYLQDENSVAQAKATLELFTALTKQDKQVGVFSSR